MNRFVYLRPSAPAHDCQPPGGSFRTDARCRVLDIGTTMAGLISSAIEDLLHNLESQNG